ncbi:hypothetical protein EV643_114223 [Kribbella sp. VKM Ac-2527]|uniref:Uncharacterized protein n=1 Tax=Kribbella caucasensis TaxID=2512215 RepID=A0A4R6K8J8_9ACTN|nr:hypothetical protein [Kribbella sp. VKM Ac-2527]TDO45078.1 hypothetical protein EV643_114223 [Kribbella sp. VKM Ac-2527]
MTTATEAAFRRQYRLEHRDGRVHQGAAADPGSGSPVSQDALTSLRHKVDAAYKSAQGASQALTALSKATPPPLQQGEARTNTGTGERQGAQTDRTTGREGQIR